MVMVMIMMMIMFISQSPFETMPTIHNNNNDIGKGKRTLLPAGLLNLGGHAVSY